MPNMENTIAPARKVLPIIFVVDTSGSMSGERIASVNEAMHDSCDLLRELSDKNPDAEMKIGVLSFASGAEWITKNGLVFLDDFYWNDLRAGGVTDFGSALKELDDKLSRSRFLISETGFCKPVIIFMSDGEPTDDYGKALERIKQNNKWFKYATKIAIAIGDDADLTVLTSIVGNKEAVVRTNDQETLKLLIKAVSVTSSMINSTSRTTSAEDDVSQIMSDVKQTLEGEQGADFETGEELADEIDDSVVESFDVDDSDDSDGGWGDDDWND